MIYFTVSIANPWAKENFANLFNRSGMITKHKAWEFEVIRHARTVFEVSFVWSHRTDHAGPTLELGLFGYSISAQIYDTRHWDFKKGIWEMEEQNG